LIAKASLPGSTDILIIESTYGGIDSSKLHSWKEESVRFADEAIKILIKGGSILIPVFSLGKTQEMLAVIWKLMLKKKLPVIDIYTAGLSRKINRVYDYNRYVVNMCDPEFELKNIPQKNYYELKSIEELFKEPCIILASSGMMLPGTLSYKLALRWLRQKNAAIFTVGYMDKSTPGYKIANTSKGGKIKIGNRKEETVECTIKNFRFSSHANRDGLQKIVDKLKPSTVILVHGEPEAIDWMGSVILKKVKGIKVFKGETGKEIIL
jgi:Cft2 family RNA processing exonuclease